MTPKEIDNAATELVALNRLSVSPDALYATSQEFQEQELVLMKTLDNFAATAMKKLQMKTPGAGHE
ncbi:MAG: hypothetical protein L0Z73_15120 [Gammaproteobacteria bacterium]|nr:hypothetical protein [Gammaproteobacteria bacterium]